MIELDGRYWANRNGQDCLNDDMVAGGVKGNIVVRFTHDGRMTKLNTTFITILAEVSSETNSSAMVATRQREQ
jgi:hypothetical protein